MTAAFIIPMAAAGLQVRFGRPHGPPMDHKSCFSRRFVYRTFGPEGQGLRIMDIATSQVMPIGAGYDNFPLWSPPGDVIVFSRQDAGDYEIYSIKPDGTGLKRLTQTASTSCSRRRDSGSRTKCRTRTLRNRMARFS